MGILKTYRAYFSYKDDKGNKIDQEMPWPQDTFKLIQEYDVPSAMKEFEKKFPNHRLIGLAGTDDLTREFIEDLMKKQGHEAYIK